MEALCLKNNISRFLAGIAAFFAISFAFPGHVFALTANAAIGDGLIVYEDTTTTPQWRDYTNSSNVFGAEANTVAGAIGRNFVIRTSPTKKEAIAAYTNSTGTLYVMCYDGTAWTNEWNVAVGGTATARRFDVAYETATGDAMVLYSTNTGTNNELAYRTKPGATGCATANWAAATNLSAAGTDGIVWWVKLAWDRRSGSNLIAAIWADAASDLSAMVWSGAAWGNEPGAALETALEVQTNPQDVDDFDVEYESLSGDVMVVWANSTGANGTNGVEYTTCTGGTSSCAWSGAIPPPTWSDDATNLDISANPDTDEIVFASIGNSGGDLQVGYWSGSAWTNTADYDTLSQAPFAGTQFVATGWLISGATARSVIVYYDSGATNIGWVVGDGGVFTTQADWVITPNFGAQRWYNIVADPVNKDRLMFMTSDSNNDFFAKRLVMDATPAFTWTDADGGVAIEASLAQAIASPYSFDYWRFLPPEVSDLSVVNPGSGGALDLSWTNPVYSTFDGIKIVRDTAVPFIGCGSGTVVYDGAVKTSHNDTGLANGTPYYYLVCTRDSDGAAGAPIAYSDGISGSGTPTDASPAVGAVTPANIATATHVDGTFDLSASVTEANTVTSCEYTVNNGSTWLAATVGGSAPNWTCTKTGITSSNGTVLTLNIRATDDNSNVGTGTAISRTVDTVVPAAGGTFTATAGAGQCVLSWTAATDVGGSGMHSSEPYEVRYGTSDPVNCAGGSLAYTGASLGYTQPWLTSGVTYYYKLCYKDNVDNQSSFATMRTCVPTAGTSVYTSGLLAYGDTTNAGYLKFKTLTVPDTFSAEFSGPATSGSNIAFTAAKNAPARDEVMIGQIKADGRLDVVRCVGGCDAAGDVTAQFNKTGVALAMACNAASGDCWRPFDIAYESLSGDAMVAFGLNATANTLQYCSWNGTAWSPASCATPSTFALSAANCGTASTGALRWVRLIPRGEKLKGMRTNEVLMVAEDENSDIFAAIWDGSAWGNCSMITNNSSTINNQNFDGAWEYATGDAMVVWAESAVASAAPYRYKKWTRETTAWDSGATALPDLSAATNIGNWVRLAGAETTGSTHIAVMTLSATAIGGATGLAVPYIWDGAAMTKGNEWGSIETTLSPALGVAFESLNSDAQAFYVSSLGGFNDDTGYETWDDTNGFSPATVSDNLGDGTADMLDDAAGHFLVASPNSNDIWIMGNDLNDSLSEHRWDGAAQKAAGWTNSLETALSPLDNTAQNEGQSYALAMRPYSPWSRNWRWTSDTTANPPGSWLAAQNATPSGVGAAAALRLRFNMAELAAHGQTNGRKTLQFTTGDPNLPSTAWTDVDAQAGTGVWRYADCAAGADDAAVTGALQLTGSTVAGVYVEDGTAASTFDHVAMSVPEWDFCIANNSADGNRTYYFRAYDNNLLAPVFREQSASYTYPSLTTGNAPPSVISGPTPSSSDSGAYVDGAFTITTEFNDRNIPLTGCEYTLNNGTSWTAASFSGSGANAQCQTTAATCANGTALTIGMRATNAGGTAATGTIARTCDTVAPTAGASFTATAGAGECVLSWAAAADGGSGMHSEEAYEIRYGASDPLTCAGGERKYIGVDLTTTHTRLSSGITYYYRLCYKDAVDNQSQFGSVRTCVPNPGAPVNTSGLVAYGDTAGGIPTFVAAGAVASGTGAITPAFPIGITMDDILLLFLETSNQAITIPTPNGGTWTEVAGSPQGTGTAVTSTATRLTVFWSRYNGTQGAPTTSDSDDHQIGRMIAVRGVISSGDPWDVTAGGVNATASTTGTIPGATTTVVNTLVVTAISTALPDSSSTFNFSNWNNGNLSNLTERIDNTTANGDGGGLGIATGGMAAAGAYGNTTVSLNNSSVKAMMSIALKPELARPTKVRRFSGGGFSTIESGANAPITTAVTYVVNKSAPTRNEYMVGTIHATNSNLAVQSGTYDSATAMWTWTDRFSTTTAGTYRYFDIAYEQISGDALIVYEDSILANQTLKYRTWDGTTFSGEQTLTYTAASGIGRYVKLIPKAGSNQILLVFQDSVNRASAYVWDGGAFTNGGIVATGGGVSNVTLSANAIRNSVAGAWEGTSGDALVVYGNANNGISHATSASGTGPWTITADSIPTLGSSIYYISVAGDPTSDYAGMIALTGTGPNRVARVWTGSAWETASPVPPADVVARLTSQVDVAWQRKGGKAVFAWSDSATNYIRYMTYTRGAPGVWSDLYTAPQAWPNAVTNVQLTPNHTFTVGDQIMLTGINGTSPFAIKSILWVNGVWSSPMNSDYEATASNGANGTQAAMFAWKKLPDDVTDLTAVSPGTGNQLNLSWTMPTGDYAGVIVSRSAGSIPPADYCVAPVGITSGTTLSDGALIDGQTYTYRICTYDSANNVSGGAVASGTPTDTVPPGNVTNFTATAGTNQVTLSWTKPGDSDFAGARIRRLATTAPTDCTTSGTVVYEGNQITFNDINLGADTYGYRACAYDEVPNYAAGATLTVALSSIAADTTPPAAKPLTVSLQYTRGIRLTWTAPGDDGDTAETSASLYDIRFLDGCDYSANITPTYMNTNWANLFQAESEPAPKIQGSAETYFLSKYTQPATTVCASPTTAGSGRKLIPNTLYYLSLKSYDDKNNAVTLPANVASAHTALKYGYNMVSLPYNPGASTPNALFSDDVTPVWMSRWTPSGMDDSSGGFSGAWEYIDPASPSAITNAQGYYLYAYGMDQSIIDETPSGVSDNSGVNWVKIDISLGRNIVGNPYLKNVNFSNVKICRSATGFVNTTAVTGNPCTGTSSPGTFKTFVEAVTAGWMDGSIAYYANATTFTGETCNSITCTASMRPWWGHVVYRIIDDANTYWLAIPKP